MIGGLQGGILGLVVGGLSYRFWPTYRTFTIPFKTFIQLGLMLAGGVIGVNEELIRYEERLRYQYLAERQSRIEAAAERGEYVDITGKPR